MTNIIAVEQGRVRGRTSEDGLLRSFEGVPYARPPVGQLRWRPPQPAQPWRGMRDATSKGPAAPQPRLDRRSLYAEPDELQSEDCLYLNVWTGAESDIGRPVMVWLHYGGFQFGSAGNLLYDGEPMARAGATVVTLNYRLGRLGFFTHPALSAESVNGASGNYGLLDQIAALEWVQANISAFGGDPDNVTLFGVSAGGYSATCCAARHSPRACFTVL